MISQTKGRALKDMNHPQSTDAPRHAWSDVHCRLQRLTPDQATTGSKTSVCALSLHHNDSTPCERQSRRLEETTVGRGLAWWARCGGPECQRCFGRRWALARPRLLLSQEPFCDRHRARRRSTRARSRSGGTCSSLDRGRCVLRQASGVLGISLEFPDTRALVWVQSQGALRVRLLDRARLWHWTTYGLLDWLVIQSSFQTSSHKHAGDTLDDCPLAGANSG